MDRIVVAFANAEAQRRILRLLESNGLSPAGSCFSGSQDDPVNIHGTYLGVQRVDGRKAALAFMQPETWGRRRLPRPSAVCDFHQAGSTGRDATVYRIRL